MVVSLDEFWNESRAHKVPLSLGVYGWRDTLGTTERFAARKLFHAWPLLFYFFRTVIEPGCFFVVVRTYDSHQSCLLWSAEQGDQIKNVLVAEATTGVVDEKGRTWQLLSDSYCYFSLFLLFACCCFLRYWRLVVLTTELSRQLLSRCWFPLLLCVFLWVNRLISVVILAERGQISIHTNLFFDQH